MCDRARTSSKARQAVRRYLRDEAHRAATREAEHLADAAAALVLF